MLRWSRRLGVSLPWSRRISVRWWYMCYLRFVVGIALTTDPHGDLFRGIDGCGTGDLRYRHGAVSCTVGECCREIICVALAILVGWSHWWCTCWRLLRSTGPPRSFRQSYAVYFFGGRYPALGNRLEPPPPAIEYVEPPRLPPCRRHPHVLPPIGGRSAALVAGLRSFSLRLFDSWRGL